MQRTISGLSIGLLALALLLMPQPGARAATQLPVEDLVTLRASSVVEDDVVRLQDLFSGIADPGLAATPVAKAPQPGASLDVGARWLAAVAKAHGLPWQPRSRYERVNLRRSSHDIPAAEIEEVLRQALAERGLAGEVRLALDNPGLRLRLPSTGERSLRITRLTLDGGSGRFLAQVAAPAQGEPVATLSVNGRAKANIFVRAYADEVPREEPPTAEQLALEMTEVPVLTRNAKAGEVIRARDIEWMSVQVNRLTRTTVVDAAGLIGMSPRRTIRAQAMIRSTDLETPVVVAKNSLVTIRLETERMQLSVQGRAMEDGARGDVVRVMNNKSNTVVNAVVIDAGRVVVRPATLAAER